MSNTFEDFHQKYLKIQNLLDEESKRDPESEPYRSKYAANEVLNEMKLNLTNLLDSCQSDDPLHDKYESMLGAVLLTLGTVAMETEELTAGEQYLNQCLQILEDKAMSNKNIVIYISTLNQLGYLWSQRGDSTKSHDYLQQAEQLYADYKDQSNETPVEVSELFGVKTQQEPEKRSENFLEKQYTLTLYYLAQVYGTLGNPIKSAVYCHNTLKRQLDSQEFDSIEWALNSATLSQFFMEKNAFHEARHHLAAAACILDKYEVEIDQQEVTEENEEELAAKKEKIKHRGGDVARCWAKYGLLLLSSSRDRLLSSEEEVGGTPVRNKAPAELSGLKFSLANLSPYEDQVTDKFVLTYEDARAVFLNAQQWLNKAKEYYTLEDHASDHVQILQDMSQMYKHLAFFEEDDERQCKMHKRRVDLLESVVKQLNPTYYLAACRQLWYELGDVYSAMLDIKLAKLQDSEDNPSPHALKKVNHLTEEAIRSYNNFLETLRDPKTKEMPSEFNSDLERPVLLAYFYLGRLYGKFITAEKAIKLANTKSSYNYFQMVFDYCERNPSAREQISVELGVCKDMVNLMPLKIIKLTEALQNN